MLAERARRTGRLEQIVHHLGLALGGRPGAGFAQRLMLLVSNDTLLRVVRRHAQPRTEPLAVIGIDDRAYRRNHRYGTIVCDLERRRVVALLPDREVTTAEAWLRQHPGINIVSRDRGGGYGEGTARALPQAVQVADRWHLMENASAAFLEAVRKSMRAIRTALGATTIDPALTKTDTVSVAAIEAGVPQLAAARALVERFQAILRKAAAELDGWTRQAKASLIGPLAAGVAQDIQAVRAAITELWSNGQTEGQITWLKLAKRQMYGRAKLGLLQARLLGAT